MVHKFIKTLTITIISLLGFTTLISMPVFAEDSCEQLISQGAPQSVIDAAGCNDTKDQLPTTVLNILNAIILVSGLIAVIFVIIGGISYMTSTGDPAKVKKAKDTILYACIGLAVCVLSFAIVNFVIVDILKAQS